MDLLDFVEDDAVTVSTQLEALQRDDPEQLDRLLLPVERHACPVFPSYELDADAASRDMRSGQGA